MKPWVYETDDPELAMDLVHRVQREVFEDGASGALDILHGSHRDGARSTREADSTSDSASSR